LAFVRIFVFVLETRADKIRIAGLTGRQMSAQ